MSKSCHRVIKRHAPNVLIVSLLFSKHKNKNTKIYVEKLLDIKEENHSTCNVVKLLLSLEKITHFYRLEIKVVGPILHNLFILALDLILHIIKLV